MKLIALARAVLRGKSAVCMPLLTLFMVSGCTIGTEPPLTATGAVNEANVRDAQLEALTDFSFSGGLGVWTDEQSVSVRLQWQQASDQLAVLLRGPLGLGTLSLVDSNGVSTLTRAKKVVARGASVDRVVQQGLGLDAPIPMEQLQLWVRGLPGNAVAIKRDTLGQVASLRFTDAQGTLWQTRFRRYVDVDGLALPSLITATGGPYSVRLVLKDWQRETVGIAPRPTQSNTRLAIPAR